MKKGQLIGIRKAFGNIELGRFYSDHRDGWINVYLHFDMSTEHSTCSEVKDIVSNKELIKILEEIS